MQNVYQESSVITQSLHFTRGQFSVSHAHSQIVHPAAAGPLTTALCTTEWEAQGETTPLFTIFTL